MVLDPNLYSPTALMAHETGSSPSAAEKTWKSLKLGCFSFMGSFNELLQKCLTPIIPSLITFCTISNSASPKTSPTLHIQAQRAACSVLFSHVYSKMSLSHTQLDESVSCICNFLTVGVQLKIRRWLTAPSISLSLTCSVESSAGGVSIRDFQEVSWSHRSNQRRSALWGQLGAEYRGEKNTRINIWSQVSNKGSQHMWRLL